MILRLRYRPAAGQPAKAARGVQCEFRARRLLGLLALFVLIGLPSAALSISARRPLAGRLASLFSKAVTVLPARIEPFEITQIHSVVPGTVVEVLVSPGAEVRAGQTLAVLSNDEVARELRVAQTRFNRAAQRLAAVRTGKLGNTRDQLERAQLEKALREIKATQQRLANFLLEEDERAWARAKERLEQVRLLREKQLLTEAELQQMEDRVLAEARNLRAAREHWLELQQTVEAGELHLQILKLQLQGSREAEIQAAQQEYEEAQAALWSARRRDLALKIIAPGAGKVTKVAVRRGQRVEANSLLFVTADVRNLTIVVPVSARLARQIRNGSPVVVRLPTEPPTRIPGTVASVLPVPDEQFKSCTVLVSAANPNPEILLVGLEAEVEFAHLGR